MAQFSVPSSTITDATFADPGNSAAQAPVGAGSLWQALANPDEGSYTQQEANAVASGIAQGVIVVGMQAVDDPLVNTDHTIRIVLRGTLAINGPTGAAGWQAVLIGGPSLFFKAIAVYDAGTAQLPPADFTEIVVPFTEQEVIDFRAAGGYSECSVDLTSSAGCSGGGDTGDTLIEVAFVQLEVPDAEPPNPNDLIGNVSIDLFDFSEFQPEEIIGDVEIDLFDESLLVDNEIIGDVTIALSDDSIFGESGEIVGDVTIELTVDAVLVMSADASGLYELIPGKTEDTLYQREDDVTTIDVAIPNPTVKTAFVGS